MMIGSPEAKARPRSVIERDAESYSIAACLTLQKPAELKQQGDGWASNVLQRSDLTVAQLHRLADAVESRVKRGEMSGIMLEKPPMTPLDLPVQYCAEIIDYPDVRAAIEATVVGVSRKNMPVKAK